MLLSSAVTHGEHMVLARGLTCGASGAIVWTQKRLTQMWVNKPGSQWFQQGSSRLRGSNLLCRATSRQRRRIDMEMWKEQGTKPGRGDDMLEVLVPVKVQGINASGDLVVFFPQAA